MLRLRMLSRYLPAALLALLASPRGDAGEGPVREPSAAGTADRRVDVTELVRRLPTDLVTIDTDLEERIARLGDRAIPALEEELRLSIPSKTLDRLFRAEGSRRWAVLRVLARIPGGRSTDLLVRSLSAPLTNRVMREDMLRALEGRPLSDEQVVRMLENREHDVVLGGIIRAAARMATPSIKAAVERILDRQVAVAQFKNEYGYPTANADGLWKVRLAAGRALKQDMVPEMRARATQVLGELKAGTLSPAKSGRSARRKYVPPPEVTISQALSSLAALGQPVRDLVEREAQTDEGDYAKVLDMALARLGDRSRIPRVATHLTESPSWAIRFCAARTLRKVKDPSAIAALRKALRDPHHVPPHLGDEDIYPVRNVAADALIDLGEDPKSVREAMRRTE